MIYDGVFKAKVLHYLVVHARTLGVDNGKYRVRVLGHHKCGHALSHDDQMVDFIALSINSCAGMVVIRVEA